MKTPLILIIQQSHYHHPSSVAIQSPRRMNICHSSTRSHTLTLSFGLVERIWVVDGSICGTRASDQIGGNPDPAFGRLIQPNDIESPWLYNSDFPLRFTGPVIRQESETCTAKGLYHFGAEARYTLLRSDYCSGELRQSKLLRALVRLLAIDTAR